MTTTSFVERHDLRTGYDEDRLRQALEVLDEHRIEHVLVSMCDGAGVSRVKSIAARTFADAVGNGVPYQSGVLSLDGAGDFVAGTGYDFTLGGQCFLLFPDPASLFPSPWHPGTAVVMADPYLMDGRPADGAPRLTLRRALAELERRERTITWGWEFEFYTFTRGADGELTPTTPDTQALHQVRHRQSTPMFEALHEGLGRAGIELTDVIQEYGPGQLEVNFGPDSGLHGVDRAFFFRYAVKEILAKMGIVATFMTKPVPGAPASGCHLHQSLRDAEGAPTFGDDADPDGVSSELRAWAGGQVRRAAALTALATQTVNGYKRYVPHSFAPFNASCGWENRTTMVRVPLTRGAGTRVENRLPEAATNPYIAAAGMIATGVLGLEDAAITEFVDGNAYELDLPPLPATLEHALAALEADADLRRILGEPFIRLYGAIKRNELRRFRQHVTDWERREYLELS